MHPRCLKNKCSNGCRNRHGQEHLFWTTTSKIHQNRAQNPPELVPKSSKIGPKFVSWGGFGPIMKNATFLLPFLPLFPPSGRHLGANLGPKLAQVGPTWLQIRPSWPQDASRRRQVGPGWRQSRPSSRQNGPKMAFQRIFLPFSRDVQICIDFSTDLESIFHDFLMPRNLNFSVFA